MNDLKDLLLRYLEKQGFSVLLLIIAIWYFHGRTSALENKWYDCNADTLEMIREQNTTLINAMERNSKAMEDIGAYLKTLNDARVK